MLRGAAFLLLACWIASDSAASAQPVDAYECSLQPIVIAIAEGRAPNVSGCELNVVANNLREAGRPPGTPGNVADANVEKGRVSSVSIHEKSSTIYVSTGAPKPRFSIYAPTTVQEGGQLTITVRRDGSDGQAHQITFTAVPAALLDDEISALTFEAAKDVETFDVATAQGQPGDGSHELNIRFTTDENAEGDDPVTVTVTDAPPVTYAIDPPTSVNRGDPLEFTVSRSDTRRADSVDYYFTQDGRNFRPKGARHPLIFEEGDETESLTLPNDAYLPCKLPPTLILRLEAPVEGTASFLDQPPAYCDPPPEFPPPWWWIPACLFGIAATGYGTRKYWFPWPRPHLYPKWTLEAVEPTGDTSLPAIPGWPSFSARTDLEWGGASLPRPLPIAEEENG